MFDTDEIRLEAGHNPVVHFENRDVSSVRHNIAVYRDECAPQAIFQGEIIPGEPASNTSARRLPLVNTSFVAMSIPE